jgi:polysaccharide deacetylase family protein (PEP-CTERM system associated)
MASPIGQAAVSHFFTVDVEEYFQVNAFEGVVSRDRWCSFPTRIEAAVDRVLGLMDRHNVRGTFFTLGWIAQHHPRVVARIASCGHEVASHGWWHHKLSVLTPDAFREEVRSSKAALEAIAGAPVVGFRAPSFSIVPGREWAFDVLIEEGYQYDSSLFPVNRSDYGYPTAPPIAHMIQRPSGVLCEFPLATTVWNGVRIPAAGGGYFRHFPYNIIRRAFREHSASGMPAVFYIHPWEVDPEQPRLPVSLLTRVRHYGGLRNTEERLRRLLSEFRFTAIRDRLHEAVSAKPAIEAAAAAEARRATRA